MIQWWTSHQLVIKFFFINKLHKTEIYGHTKVSLENFIEFLETRDRRNGIYFEEKIGRNVRDKGKFLVSGIFLTLIKGSHFTIFMFLLFYITSVNGNNKKIYIK